MHLLTLILGIMLLPTATTLKCYECLPTSVGTCKDTEKECPSAGHQCGALRITSFAGGSIPADVHMKTCVLAEQCLGGSVNFGIIKFRIATKCCTSDLCNIQPAPDPKKTIPNGKKCYRCNGLKCTATLNCEGNEDHCISNKGDGTAMMKGCASSQMCSNINNAKIKAAIGGEISCCQGDYCNSARSTGASLLLLVAPLVSMVIFS